MKSIARTKLFIYNSDLMCQHIIISLVPASSFTAYVASQYFVCVFFFFVFIFFYFVHIYVIWKWCWKPKTRFHHHSGWPTNFIQFCVPLMAHCWSSIGQFDDSSITMKVVDMDILQTASWPYLPYWKYILHFLRTCSDVAQPLFKHPIWSCINFIL